MFRKCIHFLRARFRKFLLEEYWLEDYLKLGMKIGRDCHIQSGLTVDVSHCWLIEIGNEVIIAPNVYLLAHDTSTKDFTGYTKIGRINIKDKVFIGACTMIMPGVTIGENSIIGANSVVSKSIPANVVAAGNPAKVLFSREERQRILDEAFRSAPRFSEEYTLHGGIDDYQKEEMRRLLESDKIGFVK